MVTEANNGEFDKIHKYIRHLKKKRKITHYDLSTDIVHDSISKLMLLHAM